MTEKEILSKIQSYNFYTAVKKELEGQLESLVCKITTEYGDASGVTGGNYESKVEKIAIKRDRVKSKIHAIDLLLQEIKDLIEHSGLDQLEQEILWRVAKCESLISYARNKKIYKSTVYKIRDRAIKMIYNKIQNVV